MSEENKHKQQFWAKNKIAFMCHCIIIPNHTPWTTNSLQTILELYSETNHVNYVFKYVIIIVSAEHLIMYLSNISKLFYVFRFCMYY